MAKPRLNKPGQPIGHWPPYRVGNPDYIHALGVISSVYNLLEFRFRSLFQMYTRMPTDPAYMLFAKLNNDMRLELISSSIGFSSHPQQIKEHVRHFLTGFEICSDNRNVLVHSTVFFIFGPGDESCPALGPPGQQPEGMGFQKSPKSNPFRINTYQMTLDEIRAHADAMKAFEQYGDRLYWHILKNYEPDRYRSFGFPEEALFALPDRPALPNPLVPARSDTLEK